MKSLFRTLKIILLSSSLLITSYADLPELSSNEPIEYDENSQEIILRGAAELSSEKALIKANEIRLNNENSNTCATGDVKINMNDLRLITETMQYNLSTEALSSGYFRAGKSPFYISGTNTSGTLNDLNIDNATVLLGEPDFLNPTLCASNLEVKNAHEENIPTKIIARNIWFKIGNVPFFYWPYFSHSIQEFPFQIASEYGKSKEYGPYIRNTIFFRTTPRLKIGALVDLYKDRGFLIGPAFKYISRVHCKQVYSDFQSGFIHDNGDRAQLGVDSLGRKTPRSRNFIEWYHQQNFTENFQITSQLRRWSDSNSLRDFRPKLFNNDNDPDSFAEAVYSGHNYYLTAFTRYSPNNFQNVPQRIPELNFQLLPTRICGTPIFQTINARVAHLHSNNHCRKDKHKEDRNNNGHQQHKEDGNNNGHEHNCKHHKHKHHHLTSDRIDIFYGLHAPFHFEDIMTFTPLIGGQIDEYFKKNTSRGDFTRLRGQIGFDLQFNSYAQWNYVNPTWGINGLRHIFRPTVQYRYIPQHSIGKRPIPKIDRHVFTTNIRPLDLNYQRDIDTARTQNVIRFGLENLLQTRGPFYGSRDLAYFNLYQDYLLRARPHDHHWSHLYTEFGIFPAYWINFTLYNRIDVRRPKLSEFNTALVLTDARFWSLTYITSFLHKKSHSIDNRHQHGLNITYRLTPRTYISAEALYDVKLHKITKGTFALDTQLTNAWGAQLQVTHRRKAVRESKWEVGLVIHLLPLDCDLLPIPLL